MTEWTRQRTDNANSIWNICKEFDFIRTPQVPDYIIHAHYKCYIFVERAKLPLNWNRDRLIHELNRSGVPCYQGSCSEVYLEQAFKNTDWIPKNRLPNAKALGETSLMFLVHPTINESELSRTINVISDTLKKI